MEMATTNPRRAWKWRSMVSYYLLFVGIVVSVSGVVLYAAPPGRVAHSTDWHLFALDKDQWAAVHTLASYMSIIFSIVHLILNWKPFIHYLWNRVNKAYEVKSEVLVAAAITIVVFVGSVIPVPPFSTVMDFGETLTESWEDDGAAPIILPAEHGEITTEENEEQEDHKKPGEASAGWGRYTVEDLCLQAEMAVEDCVTNLAAYEIEAEASSRIRTLADTTGYTPSNIVDILLGLELGTTEDTTSETAENNAETTE